MCEAMLTELALRKDFFDAQTPLTTIYFGGGTPSVFSPQEIQLLTDCIFENYAISPTNLAEATLEANPEDINQAYIRALRQHTPIRRLSIGIQSFRQQDLLWMNRKHAEVDIPAMIRMCQDEGMENISIDLIFGLPEMSEEIWAEQLQKAIDLNIQHISVYALTVEEKTTLAHQVRKKQVFMPEDTRFETQFLKANQLLSAAGFEHYELSNYAKKGYKAHHNAAYWKNEPYLGIGPSAHAFDGKQRSWNIANNARYLEKLNHKELAIEESEMLSPIDACNEYIMTHLRIAEGIEFAYLQAQFGAALFQKVLHQWQHSPYKDKFMHTSTHLYLTPEAWLLSDKLIGELFV